MPAVSELERMIVVLEADVTAYKQGLEKAASATKRSTEDMAKAVHRAGQEVTRSVMTSQERYGEKVRELDGLHRLGVISQETHTRAVKKAAEEAQRSSGAYDSLASSVKSLGVAWAVTKAVQFTRWIVDNSTAMRDLNYETERATQLNSRLAAASQARASKQLESVMMIPQGGARQDALAQAVAAQEKEVGGLANAFNSAKKEADELAASWGEFLNPQSMVSGRPEQKVLDATMKEAQGRLEAGRAQLQKLREEMRDALNPAGDLRVQKQVRDTTAALQMQIQVFGMNAEAAAAYKLQLLGASDAQTANARGLQQMVDWLNQDKKAKEEAAAATKRLGDEVRGLTTSLEAEMATFGLAADAARLYKLQLDGASESQLANAKGLTQMKRDAEAMKKIMEEGARVTEQAYSRDPVLSYQREMQNLNRLLEAGAISQQIYGLAAAQATEALARAGKTAAQAQRQVDAAQSGSAEARQRIEKFADKAKGRGQAAPRQVDAAANGGADAGERQNKQIDKLEQIRGLLAKQVERPVVMLMPANL